MARLNQGWVLPSNLKMRDSVTIPDTQEIAPPLAASNEDLRATGEARSRSLRQTRQRSSPENGVFPVYRRRTQADAVQKPGVTGRPAAAWLSDSSLWPGRDASLTGRV